MKFRLVDDNSKQAEIETREEIYALYLAPEDIRSEYVANIRKKSAWLLLWVLGVPLLALVIASAALLSGAGVLCAAPTAVTTATLAALAFAVVKTK